MPRRPRRDALSLSGVYPVIPPLVLGSAVYAFENDNVYSRVRDTTTRPLVLERRHMPELRGFSSFSSAAFPLSASILMLA